MTDPVLLAAAAALGAAFTIAGYWTGEAVRQWRHRERCRRRQAMSPLAKPAVDWSPEMTTWTYSVGRPERRHSVVKEHARGAVAGPDPDQ